LRKLNFIENLFIVTVILHDDLCSFMVMPRSSCLTINVSDTDCSENQNKQFTFSIYIFESHVFMSQYIKLWHYQTSHKCHFYLWPCNKTKSEIYVILS